MVHRNALGTRSTCVLGKCWGFAVRDGAKQSLVYFMINLFISLIQFYRLLVPCSQNNKPTPVPPPPPKKMHVSPPQNPPLPLSRFQFPLHPQPNRGGRGRNPPPPPDPQVEDSFLKRRTPGSTNHSFSLHEATPTFQRQANHGRGCGKKLASMGVYPGRGGGLQLVLMRQPPSPRYLSILGGGGVGVGWGGSWGGGGGGGVSAGGGGGGIGSLAGGGGLRATHYYHMHTSRGCLRAWGHRGMYAIIAISCLCQQESRKGLKD